MTSLIDTLGYDLKQLDNIPEEICFEQKDVKHQAKKKKLSKKCIIIYLAKILKYGCSDSTKVKRSQTFI